LRFADCDVPYVLDASQLRDQSYALSHFGDLVQQYCITGTVDGSDISSFPEKMYYGQHDAGETLSLIQTSMTSALSPAWSVKVDFAPDSSVTPASVWHVALGGERLPQASVGLIRCA
jgi:hypothetical protein